MWPLHPHFQIRYRVCELDLIQHSLIQEQRYQVQRILGILELGQVSLLQIQWGLIRFHGQVQVVKT